MSARGRRLRRWALRGALGVGALAAALLLALGLLLGTARGRGLVLGVVLEQVNRNIPGRLAIEAIDRLSPFGVSLRGVELQEPSSDPVLRIERVSAELAPAALLGGRIVIRSLTIGPGHVDLEHIQDEGRGLLAALVDPAAPPAPPSDAPPPRVRIEALELRELSVRAPELPPPWDELAIEQLNAAARIDIDGDPEVVLSSLSCALTRSGQPLARVTSASAHLARPGQASDVTLALALGEATLALRGHAQLAPPGSIETQPLGAELQLAGFAAADLARLLDDPGLAAAFSGPVSLDATLAGTLADLRLQAGLGSAGGALSLQAGLRERHALDAVASSPGLVLARVLPGLPEPALGFQLTGSADLADAAHIPLELRLAQARFAELELPEVVARGRYEGRGVSGLDLWLTRGQSVIASQGDANADGVLDLRLQADVRAPELREVATALGLPHAPDGSLRADLHLAHAASGLLSARGNLRAQRLRLPGLSLALGRVDLDIGGPFPLLSGTADVALSGLDAAGVPVPRLELRVDARPGEYRARGRVEVERLRTRLDLRAARAGSDWRLRGQAEGQYAEAPLTLSIAPTTIAADGSVRSDGLQLRAGGQELRVRGRYARSGVELSAHAPHLELGTLAQLLGLGPEYAGRIALDAELRGQPDVPRLDATLDARGVARAGKAPLDARLELGLDAAAGSLHLAGTFGAERAELLAGSLSLASEFRGGPGWSERLLEARHRLELQLQRVDLALADAWLEKPLDAAGHAALTLTVFGTLAEPALHAALTSELERGFGLSAQHHQLQLDYDGGRLHTELAVADPSGPWLDASARLELVADESRDPRALARQLRVLADRSRWNLQLKLARRRLGALWLGAPSALSGVTLAGELQASHELGREPSARAAFAFAETGGRVSPAGCTAAGVELALTAALAEGKLAAKLTAQHGQNELLRAETNARLELAPALRGGAASIGSFAASLLSRGLALEQVPYLCQRLRGRLDARVQLEDVLGGKPALAASVDARGLSLGAPPALDVALRATADDAAAQANVEITAPGGRSTLAARVPIHWAGGRLTVAADAPLSASARLVALPIAPLLDPAGALSYATGLIDGNVIVAGTLAAPEPSGELELREAELTATALAQPLHGVKGRFAFNREALQIRGFEARDRDGVLGLSGSVSRQGPDALRVQLDARAKAFPLRQRGQVVATTSGRAKVDATLTRERTTVAVKLMDADTWLEKVQARAGIDLAPHPDFVLAGSAAAGAPAAAATPAGGAGAAPEAASPGAGSTPRESQISIDASDHFWIKREDFAIQLSARLQAEIVDDEAKIKGRVDIYRGYLDLLGRVFDVERGSHLDFIGSSTPDPVVAITAAYEQRSSGKTIRVQISGRGSKPELTFFIDQDQVSAGEVVTELLGQRGGGNEQSAKQDAASFVSGLTAGLLATSARRELGAAAPIIMIEPGEQTGDGRIRAGFELDTLVPAALRQLITGVYVEGIVEREGSGNQRTQGQGQQTSTQAGVLLELYFPHQLFSTGQWGPGTTWSLDWGWQL